jgi:hypothetical protein
MLSRCARVRTKVHRNDYCCSMRIVYDPIKLPEVTTAKLRVVEVLQLVSKATGCTSQLRRIQ